MPRPASTGSRLAACARACVLAMLLLAVQTAAASPSSTRERGLQLAREGRCPGALAELDRVRQASPADAELHLVRGQCLIRLQRYAEAVDALETARAIEPERPGVDVSLAIALYHLEQRDAAREALDRAEARDPERANVQLYRGLMLLDASENESGAAALERARGLDPGYAEPVSSFYQGVALAEQDRERARRALTRVVVDWPGTSWADEAQRILDRLDAPPFQWWVEGTVGTEYDTNVVLRGSGVELPRQISDEKDWRGVWTLSAGSSVFQDELWTVGLMGSYYGTRQHDVTEFDTHYPTVSAWVDRVLTEESVARVRYEFGHAWVDGDAYLVEHVLEGSLFHDFGAFGRTRLDLRWVRDDFRFDTFEVPDGNGTPGLPCSGNSSTCGPPGLNEASARNRDGWELGPGILHVLPLPELPGIENPTARGGYSWSWRDSRGREYSYQQHAFLLGSSAGLPGSLLLDLYVGFKYRPFEHPSTFPDRTPTNGVEYGLKPTNKREREWNVGASLERAIWKQLSLVLSWRYDDNDSTARVFDYDRHVVGLRVKGRLGP